MTQKRVSRAKGRAGTKPPAEDVEPTLTAEERLARVEQIQRLHLEQTGKELSARQIARDMRRSVDSVKDWTRTNPAKRRDVPEHDLQHIELLYGLRAPLAQLKDEE